MDYFSNTVKVEWVKNEPRRMRLLEDVSFIDAKGKEWLAPEGSLIDGASIPKICYSIIGPPFIGFYRRASVIHDVYCESKIESHEAVHKMFYEALKHEGVSSRKAWAMYTAVKLFGPKWA
ncbi:MAG: DUF1353 domain-containing protein [bacterium]|nr:DUF1353 domain-containing protein [bacterium]